MTTKYITFTTAGNTIITARAISPDGLDIIVNQPIESVNVFTPQTQPVIVTNTPTFTEPSVTIVPPQQTVEQPVIITEPIIQTAVGDGEQPITRTIDGGATNIPPTPAQTRPRNPRAARR